jgi:hypothetical protein
MLLMAYSFREGDWEHDERASGSGSQAILDVPVVTIKSRCICATVII